MAAVMLLLMSALTACGMGDGKAAPDSESEPQESASEQEQGDPANAEAEKKNVTEPDIDYLILVDQSNPVPDDWEEKLTLAYTCNAVGDDVYAEVTAYRAYLEMKEELEKQDVHVDLDSGFRSLAAQQKIVDDFTERYGESYAKTYAAVPGYSEHHTGLALDLFLIVDGDIIYENEDLMKYPEVWAKIHEILPDYGFILRYPGGHGYAYEPWHIRYVGKEAARKITDNNLTLEEYIITSGE